MTDRRHAPDRRTMPLRVGEGRREADAVDDALRAQRLLDKLPCPGCRCGRSRVIDTRPHPYRRGVWRRRQCAACGLFYETIEQPIADNSDPRLLRNVNT